jgi:tetraacyldisaccharide 4'-kinase
MRNELLWSRKRTASPPVRLLSDVWGLVNSLRRKAYRKGVFRSERAPLPVISVGNLTAGGSAKTPMCIYLSNMLTERGLSPAVLSRGYGRKRSRFYPEPVIVSLGLGPLAPLEFSGDEPYLTASLTQAMVIVSKKRILAAREAASQGADVLVLDDGFQHLSLKRDVDILMVQADNPFGNGRVLPAGPLREPLKANVDADIFVSVGEREAPEGLQRLAGGKPLFTAVIRSGPLLSLEGRKRSDPSMLKGRRFSAFCGLARPEGFRKSLSSLGLDPVAFKAFPDHEPYGPLERRELQDLLNFSRAECLVTTFKDAMKLTDLGLPVYILESALEPVDPEGLLKAVLDKLPLPLDKKMAAQETEDPLA